MRAVPPEVERAGPAEQRAAAVPAASGASPRTATALSLGPYAVLALLLAIVLPAVDYMPIADGATYLRIADHYAAGRWAEAVNTYWSPLLSWVLAPVVAVGADGLTAFKLVQAVAALGSLALTRSLLRVFDASALATAAVSYAVVGLLVYSAGSVVTPDLLLAVVLLGYVRMAVDRRMTHRHGWALAAGLLGGAAYLTKAIALPIVLAHLAVVGLVRWWSAGSAPQRRRAVAGCGVALLGVVLVAGPWIAAVSAQHGSLTVSTAATLNLEWTLPGTAGNQQFQPGLIRPPTPNALSMWEDPTVRGAPRPEAAALSEAEPTDVVGALGRNLLDNLVPSASSDALQVLMTIGVAGLLAAASALVLRKRRQTELVLVMAAAGLHGGAVLVTYLEGRYILVPLLLLLVLTGHLLGDLVRPASGWKPWLAVAALGVAAVLPFVPRVIGLMAADSPYADIGRSARDVLEGRAVASDGGGNETMWICAFARCSWHGMPRLEEGPIDVRRQLDEHGIEYYLSWSPDAPPPPPGAVPVQAVSTDRFVLYRLPPGPG